MSWQPIETSPKTSHSRLVWCQENRCCFLVYWGIWYGETKDSYYETWMLFGGYNSPLRYLPSHWQPLPDPPC